MTKEQIIDLVDKEFAKFKIYLVKTLDEKINSNIEYSESYLPNKSQIQETKQQFFTNTTVQETGSRVNPESPFAALFNNQPTQSNVNPMDAIERASKLF